MSCGKKETERSVLESERVKRPVTEFTLPMVDTSWHVKRIMMLYCILFDINKKSIKIILKMNEVAHSFDNAKV